MVKGLPLTQACWRLADVQELAPVSIFAKAMLFEIMAILSFIVEVHKGLISELAFIMGKGALNIKMDLQTSCKGSSLARISTGTSNIKKIKPQFYI